MSKNYYIASHNQKTARSAGSKKNLPKTFEQGIGYYKPNSMPHATFTKLVSEWDDKLAQSGFVDIEYRLPDNSGHFSPLFRINGSSATFQALYSEHKEVYYRLASEFLVTAKWRRLFKRKAGLFKYLFYLHSEGVPYRAQTKFLAKEKVPYPYREVKYPRKQLVQKRSVFWIHMHAAKAIKKFHKWALINHGLNLKNTLEAEVMSEKSKRKSSEYKKRVGKE